MDSTITLHKYIEELSSKSSTPGGGSVSGVSGIMACALMMMVMNLTKGKKKYKNVEKEISYIFDITKSARDSFLKLEELDQSAFKKVMNSYKDKNKDVLETALMEAAEVPLNILKTALSIYPHCLKLMQIGNQNLISDAIIAIQLLSVAISSSITNVLINLNSITSVEYVSKTKEELRVAQKQNKEYSKQALELTPKHLKID